MKVLTLGLGVTLGLGLGMTTTAHASFQAGIYAHLKRVELRPSTASDSVEVVMYGKFIFRDKEPGTFKAIREGRLYYRLPTDSTKIANTRADWTYLADIAGRKNADGNYKCVAFGNDQEPELLGSVRNATGALGKPDVYPVHMGAGQPGAHNPQCQALNANSAKK